MESTENHAYAVQGTCSGLSHALGQPCWYKLHLVLSQMEALARFTSKLGSTPLSKGAHPLLRHTSTQWAQARVLFETKSK